MTYKQAYDKIIDAYFKDEIKPFDEQFCFCGTLSPNKNWQRSSSIDAEILDHYPYTIDEYADMECALFSAMPKTKWLHIGNVSRPESGECFTEDELFSGMCAALEVLKQIHKDRGENVDGDVVQFTKRKLQTA